MPQGRKAKAKLPASVAAKKKAKPKVHSVKRANAPKPKKQVTKIKKAITKAVNANAEEELRAIAVSGKKPAAGKKASPRAAAAKKTKKK